jgi:hypothetical protein
VSVAAVAAPAVAASSHQLVFNPDQSRAEYLDTSGTWALVMGLATIGIPNGVSLQAGQLLMTVFFSPTPPTTERRLFPSEVPIGWAKLGSSWQMTDQPLVFQYGGAVTGPATVQVSFNPEFPSTVPTRRLAFSVASPPWQQGSFVLTVSAPTANPTLIASVPWISNPLGT